ncbi:MAG: hypothetical protein HBSAPP03_23050 [Phycisphaerae bacterium]|jgi:hypothetical protein|nr:MAG: hypothetical protein HBSAPP03_23050 [Phycisphaerae bacterium]
MQTNRKNVMLGIVAGIGLTALAGILMGQGASQPVKSETQYFVTGEGDEAHLWVREGTNLRCVGHGECKAHQHDHKEGDGHDHGKETPKK